MSITQASRARSRRSRIRQIVCADNWRAVFFDASDGSLITERIIGLAVTDEWDDSGPIGRRSHRPDPEDPDVEDGVVPLFVEDGGFITTSAPENFLGLSHDKDYASEEEGWKAAAKRRIERAK